MLINQTFEFFFWNGTDLATDDLTTLEDKDGWDSSNAILHCQIHIFLNVDFTDDSRFGLLGGKFINDWSNFSARRSAV